ncbi:nuclear transport factor 2 family protein [Aldersonia sp. NBC_00410]|uniref:nuclear transport factor 2 family protein n=1 Tax=Aldersonia sp. NBC_00410 TaxID=2975954 RepID=UPI00224EC09F|nr:nuclear transport factor 2 family protein [Aldersonia sp. NBC_00410]MCX5043493.1 nuclear transport factor 2 family protein [Aldersonia sp. NBC_00410]
MDEHRPLTDSPTVVERIREATNNHDLDALTDCFTSDYESIWPLHPARSFAGAEQVRRNWQEIFRSVPDVRTEVLDSVVTGATEWSEWEFAGHRLDAQPFLMRGVIILQVRGDRAASARFYLEPVETDTADADAAVRRLVGSPAGNTEAVPQ